MIQTQLPATRPVFPPSFQTEDGNEYRLLGIDEDGCGHYWLQSELLHAEVIRYDADGDCVGRAGFLAEGQVSRWIERHEWRSVSSFAQSCCNGGRR